MPARAPFPVRALLKSKGSLVANHSYFRGELAGPGRGARALLHVIAGTLAVTRLDLRIRVIVEIGLSSDAYTGSCTSPMMLEVLF